MPAFLTGEESWFQLNAVQFDFNLQFEQLFFSVIPSAIFILASLWRMANQFRKPTVVNAPLHRLIFKLGAILMYACLELSLVVLMATSTFGASRLFIAASALKLVAASAMVFVSFLDHLRSRRPSVLLESYIVLTLLLDVAQARSLFLSSKSELGNAWSSIFITALALKCGILSLESQGKSRWIQWEEQDHSPEETSGIISLGVLFWLNQMFLRGYSHVLTVKDLFPLDTSMQVSSLHRGFRERIEHAFTKGQKPGLLRALVFTLKVPLVLPILPRLAQLGFHICQPFFVERLIAQLSRSEAVDANIGYDFIGASVLIYSSIAISTALYSYLHHRCRIMVRGILVAEIYDKATILRLGASGDNAAVTLISTDIERIIFGMRTIHDAWACTIQVAIAAHMMYHHLGSVFAVSMGVVLVCMACLGYLLKFTGKAQKSWMSHVQKRVGMTAVVISSMKNLRVSGLSTAVMDFTQELRSEDLKAGSTFREINVLAALLGYIPFFVGPAFTFAFARKSLDAATIFSSLSWLLLLTNPLTQIFQAIPQILAALACLRRIQIFLQSESNIDYRKSSDPMAVNLEEAPEGNASNGRTKMLISIKDGKFGWEYDAPILRNINIEIPQYSLTIVVGPVGSGKSTLCKALLGELVLIKGNVELEATRHHIGYCEQVAFLSNGSIRENIVRFSSFDPARYAKILDATALSVDLKVLPHGDQTVVGSDGITLSGSQKQRVSLARALYLQMNLLVLDDLFSGLDADTEKHVFQEVFGLQGILACRDSTVILCTHSIRHLHAADHIIVLEEGTISQQGSFKSLTNTAGYVQNLNLTNSAISDETPTFQVTKSPCEVSDKSLGPAVPVLRNDVENLEATTDQARQTGEGTVYRKYFKAMGVPAASSVLVCGVLWGFFTSFPTVWLKFWTEDANSPLPKHSFAYYAGVYGALQGCALTSLLLLGIVILVASVNKVGANLHRDILQTLFRAPLQFFTKTDTGVITNLFSQDLNLIDTELPSALLNTLFCVSFPRARTGCCYAHGISIYGRQLPVPGSAALCSISLLSMYLKTDETARSGGEIALIGVRINLHPRTLHTYISYSTHFIDTLKGLATVRAFGFLPEEREKNVRLVDTSQRPAYLLLMIQSWLLLVLDAVVMIMAAVLTTLAVRLQCNAGFTDASLVSLMQFGDTLSGIVLYYTQLETSLGAVGRLRTFEETVLPEDSKDETVVPNEYWPRIGHIEFSGVSASYHMQASATEDRDLAIKNIELDIQPGEKIAICGRTGSGKSTLVALLLKLLDPVSESRSNIIIDDQTLQYIDRTTLRQRIVAIPQEPVFLPDGTTFRSNIDPYQIATSTQCQSVLEAFGMWPFVEQRCGLEASMRVSTLSAGQRQLLSLSRALLRRHLKSSEGGILLLDEVSSSVDYETERMMQEVISTEFEQYTVVAVSHRLDMIMNYNRVVVMDQGMIAEIGKPTILAKEEGSRFRALLKAAAK